MEYVWHVVIYVYIMYIFYKSHIIIFGFYNKSESSGEWIPIRVCTKEMVCSASIGQDLCLIGPRGEGKTFLAQQFAGCLGHSQIYTLFLGQLKWLQFLCQDHVSKMKLVSWDFLSRNYIELLKDLSSESVLELAKCFQFFQLPTSW